MRFAPRSRRTSGSRPSPTACAAEHGAEVGLRIGVNTGEVVASREAAARGELMVSGDAVNVAARLQQAAEPGEVLVGERTQVATNRVVSYGPQRSHRRQGQRDPVPAWAALAVPADPGPRGGGLSAPFIGRDDEIAMLDAVASRVAREHVAQLVTLFGQAGVGKSRLIAELLGRLPDARVLQGRCLPYGEGITYLSLGEAAKTEAAILDTDSAEAALEKLRTAIASVVDRAPDRRRRRGDRLDDRLRGARLCDRHGRPGVRPAGAGGSVAALHRRARPPAAHGARRRGHPLGVRGAARPAGAARRDARGDAGADPLHGPARVPRSPPDLGRREAERDRAHPRAALAGGIRAARLVTAGRGARAARICATRSWRARRAIRSSSRRCSRC